MVLLQRGCYQLGWWRKLAIVKMLLSFENSSVANSKYSTRLIKLNYFKTWSSLFIFSKSLISARLLFRSDYDSPQPRTSGIRARDNLIGSGPIGWMDLFWMGCAHDTCEWSFVSMPLRTYLWQSQNISFGTMTWWMGKRMNALRYCFVIYILSGSILCELSKCTLNPDHTEEICNGGGSFYRIESCRERWDISRKVCRIVLSVSSNSSNIEIF